MKKILFISFLLICVLPFHSFAQKKSETQNPEYIILWVTHALKQSGIESRLEVNIGHMNGHSMKGILTNGESGTVSFNIDGTTTVVRNEVDFFTIASSYGFKLFNVEVTDMSGKKYFQYILIKEIE